MECHQISLLRLCNVGKTPLSLCWEVRKWPKKEKGHPLPLQDVPPLGVWGDIPGIPDQVWYPQWTILSQVWEVPVPPHNLPHNVQVWLMSQGHLHCKFFCVILLYLVIYTFLDIYNYLDIYGVLGVSMPKLLFTLISLFYICVLFSWGGILPSHTCQDHQGDVDSLSLHDWGYQYPHFPKTGYQLYNSDKLLEVLPPICHHSTSDWNPKQYDWRAQQNGADW